MDYLINKSCGSAVALERIKCQAGLFAIVSCRLPLSLIF